MIHFMKEGDVMAEAVIIPLSEAVTAVYAADQWN
jgi:hypothetical protein